MITEDKINKLIDDTYVNMEQSKKMFGKEIYQKRFKPVFEGYLTALCTVLDLPNDKRTEVIRNEKNSKP